MASEVYDIAECLDSDEIIAEYLTAALEENDPAFFAAALGDVARARGLTHLSQETGLSRMGLYKLLSKEGNPTLSSLQKICATLNLKLAVVPAEQ